MKEYLWSRLRDARYALPQYLARWSRGPDAARTARLCAKLEQKQRSTAAGYFQAPQASPEQIAQANLLLIATLASQGSDTYLSLKAPPMQFDARLIRRIVEAAHQAGMSCVFDAHAPKDADQTLALVTDLLQSLPGTGCALPARWRRTSRDAARLRDSSARLRIVKGEWPDPESPDEDINGAYLRLIDQLAGRQAPVAVATHHPQLAHSALSRLIQSGTPCELEQLYGLPSRRTLQIARQLGVPVRVYIPFGPGWWPYVIDKALARPYLPVWALRDALALPDPD